MHYETYYLVGACDTPAHALMWISRHNGPTGLSTRER